MMNDIQNNDNTQPEFLEFNENDKELQHDNLKIINNKFLFTEGGDDDNMFSYEDFIKHDTIIIKSCTGTGKTTATAEHHNQMKNEETNKHYKFLSIVDKISLSQEHIKSFKKLNMVSYKESDNILKSDASVICINSLLKLQSITNDELKIMVVYIDEVDSFLKFTHNSTIKCIKMIYRLLKRIVNNCFKLIVSDATIMNNLSLFLKNRKSDNSLFITNNFKKYEDINAYHHNDEEAFLNKLLENVQQNKGFLYGSDSRQIILKHYEYCKKHAPEISEDKFIIITQQDKFKITNATEQFKNKFVFYSPSIVYGVDFNNIDIFQDVFIYICGKSIEPSQSFQQASRTRYIKNLHFYGQDKNSVVKHKTLKEVRSYIRSSVSNMPRIKQLFEIHTDTDLVEYDVKVFKSFYNLYAYNQYINNVYNSNKVKHFKNILSNYGFNVVELGDINNPSKLSEEENKTLNELVETRYENMVEEYIHSENKTNVKFDLIHQRASYLGLTTKESLTTYKSILLNIKEFEEHIKVLRYIRTDDYINEKLKEKTSHEFDITFCTNAYLKIKALKTIEKQYNLNISTGILNDSKETIDLDDSIFKLIRTNYKQKKPTTKNELIKFYITTIKHHTDANIVATTRLSNGENRRKYIYELNNPLILYHLELNEYKNRTFSNISEQFTKIYFDKYNGKFQRYGKNITDNN